MHKTRLVIIYFNVHFDVIKFPTHLPQPILVVFDVMSFSTKWFRRKVMEAFNTEIIKNLVPVMVIYDDTPNQYTAIFHGCKNDNFQMKNGDIFLIFAQNIDRGAVLTCTHDLCFRAKIRKNVYPCKLQFYCIKVGCKGGSTLHGHVSTMAPCCFYDKYEGHDVVLGFKISPERLKKSGIDVTTP